MPIDTTRSGSTFIVTLNRPEAMNSIDVDMFFGLGAAWQEFEADPSLLVAVVTGEGSRAFCAGRDLVKSSRDASDDWSKRRDESRFLPDAVTKPVVAAVNGHCLAAGLGLALACDLRVAAENATFGTMAAKRGIVAGSGQTQRLARYIPFGKAVEMVITGDRMDAAEAYRIGLVNRLVPAGEALDNALAWAAEIADNGPLAVKAMKKLAYEGGLEMGLTDGIALELQLYNEILETEDAIEGPKAFAEKRKAVFKGR